jgi:hypothetical protein
MSVMMMAVMDVRLHLHETKVHATIRQGDSFCPKAVFSIPGIKF